MVVKAVVAPVDVYEWVMLLTDLRLQWLDLNDETAACPVVSQNRAARPGVHS
jgi:hypothetical protein